MVLIDTPSPFASKAEWKEFLAGMEAMLRRYPKSEEVAAAIRQAKAALAA